MAVKLTEHQMNVVKEMVKLSGNFADQIYHIMENHGLNVIDGFTFAVSVNPANVYATKSICIGDSIHSDAGKIWLSKGRRSLGEKFEPFGKNSPEYELLFADEAVRSRMGKILHREKPLPPDGLWIGDDRNDPPVDCRWEWDVNDSLS